jgi:hypothetical protein
VPFPVILHFRTFFSKFKFVIQNAASHAPSISFHDKVLLGSDGFPIHRRNSPCPGQDEQEKLGYFM